VRPAGKLGTCGWTPFAWTVVYVNAHSPAAAIAKAERRGLIIHKKGVNSETAPFRSALR
jgi:hypothetical protein